MPENKQLRRMMVHNDGTDYECFVALLQQALLDSENYTNHKNITVELNKKIVDNCGVSREFDLYWEYDLGGIVYKTIIECKDYNTSIPVEKVDALIGKTKDIPDLKPVFATKTGYQSGAKKKAETNKIDLLIVREQNDSDWQDADGNPYIKQIHIHLIANLPADIVSFYPVVDGKWAEENTDLNISENHRMVARNNEVIIEDLQNEDKYSLLELGQRLTGRDKAPGSHEKEEKFENAFIYCNEMKLKLVAYKVEYLIRNPISQPILIDYSKELLGVIEYIQRGVKKAIFKKGVVKEEPLI